MKVVGTHPGPSTPVERLREAIVLIRAAEKLNPYPRPRGFIFKAKTRSAYESWRRSQDNPRLW